MSQASASPVSGLEELTPVLSDRFALKRGHVLLVLGFAATFLYYSYIPLFHSDIWGHVSYGKWILERGTLPTEDPFLELARGVPITCTSWLGQVVFGQVYLELGPQWVSNVFSITALATWMILVTACAVRSGSIQAAVICALLCWLTAWSRHMIVRPEVFGSLCFAVLLLLTARRGFGFRGDSQEKGACKPVLRSTPLFLFLIGVVFALWANLHGSFVMGFAVLGCELLGRAVDSFSRRRFASDVLFDREVWRWLLACEVAVGAALLNPYGMDLLVHTLLFPSNPNLKDVLEWFSLEMVSHEGIQVGFSWIVLAILLRHSRVRFRTADVLLLGVLILAVVMRVRMQSWYAPVLAVAMAPHLADVLRRGRLTGIAFLEARSFHNSLIALLLIWIAFSFSPVSNAVLGDTERPADQLFSEGTPIELTKWLREHPPQGQIMNPQWWGDWLVEFGPQDLQVFMTTNAVHAAPPRVWKDYLTLARFDAGYENLLDRYRINTIIVHKELQTPTERRLRTMGDWQIVYEDDVGLIARRKSVLQQKSSDKSVQLVLGDR